jgi:two-component system sensor histidine kinase UhpB
MAFNLKELLAGGPESIAAERLQVKEVPVQELGLTLLYVVLTGLWFVFADDVFDWVMGRPRDTPALQAMKGINFVTTTALVLYLVLRRSFRSRRLAEEAQRLSQLRFELVARATTDAIWDLNLETKVMWWSDGLQRLFGYRSEDVSTRFEWWVEHLHPRDKDATVEALRQVMDNGARSWDSHYRFRRQDGTYAVVQDRGHVIRDAAGKPTRIVGGISDISERCRAEEALQNSRQQLRALAARLQAGREEERTAVAREIHDQLGQVLTAIKINLDWLETKIGECSPDPSLNPMLDRVVESAAMTESAMQTVQRIATDLRPSVLDDLGLLAGLDMEARRFQQRTGINCHLQLPREPLELPREVATTIFRVFQEALTNAARHGQATQVHIRLDADPNQLMLQLEDNGKGISPEELINPRSLGLLGMRERAACLGGDVTITRITPNGTRVILRLPRISAEAQAA